MTAWYNENDPKAAAWLRALIAEKFIPDGVVDERSIEDIRPGDLAGFTQCHFFAGIGGWSRALTLAGWPDDRSVWTGSCPCQSFSAAGKGAGFDDKRHLWPAWNHLISECNPAIVFGEQVDAAVKFGWLDLVQADLECQGYAFGAAVLPAAGVGAPHGRHRIFWVAQSDGGQRYGSGDFGQGGRVEFAECRAISDMADSTARGFGIDRGAPGASGHFAQRDAISGMGDAASPRRNNPREHERGSSPLTARFEQSGTVGSMEHSEGQQMGISRLARERRETTGFWANADWIPCRDGKWRAAKSGLRVLAHGVPGRVDLLRGLGNAIVPQIAAEFIKASMT